MNCWWMDKRSTPTPKELELLYHIGRRTPNRVYTRNQLLDEVVGL